MNDSGIPRSQEQWRRFFNHFSMTALYRFMSSLGGNTTMGKNKILMINFLAGEYAGGSGLQQSIQRLEKRQLMLLEVLALWKGRAVEPYILFKILQRTGISNGQFGKIVQSLMEMGLIFVLENGSYRNTEVFLSRYDNWWRFRYRNYTIFAPEGIWEIIRPFKPPDKSTAIPPIPKKELKFTSVEPREVYNHLFLVTKLIGKVKKQFTMYGDLSSTAQKQYEIIFGQNYMEADSGYYLGLWLDLCTILGLLEKKAEDPRQFKTTENFRRILADPIDLLAGIIDAMSKMMGRISISDYRWDNDYELRDLYLYNVHKGKNRVSQIAVAFDSIINIFRPVETGKGFAKESIYHSKWITRVVTRSIWNVLLREITKTSLNDVAQLTNMIERTDEVTGHVLAFLYATGIIERAEYGGGGDVYWRATPLTLRVLSKDHDLMAPWRHKAHWKSKKSDNILLVPGKPRGGPEMSAAFLGPIASSVNTRKDGGAEFQVTVDSLNLALAQGISIQEIRQRLEYLAGPYPSRFADMINAIKASYKPFRLWLDPVLVKNFDPKHTGKAHLERSGARRIGSNSFLFPSLASFTEFRDALDSDGKPLYRFHRYDVAPEKTCRISRSGADYFLLITDESRYDLKLHRLLSDLGIKKYPLPGKVDVSSLKVASGRQIKPMLKDLERFFIRGIPETLVILLLAKAGEIDSPLVEPFFRINFKKRVFKGLLPILLGKRSVLKFDYLEDQGCFFVPGSTLAKFEELLADKEIPFPIEFSQVKKSAANKKALKELERAVEEENIK
ncbi:MAG: hypothetical protein GXP49_03470 [Deltaproteobacteria bacterium]|nr:hypothetical protein [Deltaproteobacteria bacterium]